jgi:ankyrin repeat protein
MGKIKFNLAGWKEKLLNGADINKPDEKGWTALDYAIRADSIEGVEFCINKGADVNREIEKHDYATPLHFAAKYSRKPEIIEILVKHGAKIDALDMCEYSPVNYAAFHNANPDIIKKLVELGSDINEYNVFLSAFQSACLSNPSLEVIKTIIRLGADFDVQDALCFAAVNKNVYILKYMLKLGGDINTKSKTLGKDFPLHNAVYNKNSEVLKFLLKKGAYKTINAKDEFGNTPLISAVFPGNLENIKILLEAGANVNAKNNYGETPLMKACSSNKNIEVIQILLDAGADILAKDKRGKTCFNYVVYCARNYAIFKLLLMRIKNVKTRRKYGYIIANHGKITADLIMVLRECHVDVCKSEDLSDWIFCLCVDNHKMARNVIKTGIKLHISFFHLSFRILDNPKGISAKILSLLTDINVRDENQNTVLFDFIKCNNFRIVNMLIDAGADVNAKNNQEETPLSYAVKYKAKDKIFEKLLASGANVETEDYMVKSAVAAFLERQKIKSSSTQLRLFEDKKG